MITTKIIADSINPAGDRITTGLWTYPRFLHCEILTHRMLAKNSASSRAIPVEKMIEAVRDNPAMFEQYGAANRGMEAQTLMPHAEQVVFNDDWLFMAEQACQFAERQKSRAAKQMVNRWLEPVAHMTVIITGTDWHNFFALRANSAAQPEFQVLAYRWLDAYLKSTPTVCGWGGWHLPMTAYDELQYGVEEIKKISVARCARVSYTTHSSVKTIEEDVKLHDRLLESGHMSPFEHQAQCWLQGEDDDFGCYRNWKPYRKFLPNENRTNVNLHEILANKPEWITLT